MSIFTITKSLVQKEKHYTSLVLKNLVEIEKRKLFSDLGYESLYKYVIKELKYSESEANIRINAVRLMMKSPRAEKRIAKGDLSLTNASMANKTLEKMAKQNFSEARGERSSQAIKREVDRVLDIVSKSSTRKAKEKLQETFRPQPERSEVVRLDERLLKRMDKLKKRFGVESSYELIDILIEQELKRPTLKRNQKAKVKNSRFIPKSVKVEVYTGECANCGSKRNLEYDHKKSFSTGGDNGAQNIQILCRNCNQRKMIREMGHLRRKT